MANVDVYVQSHNVGLLAKTAKADEFNEKHSFTYLASSDQALSSNLYHLSIYPKHCLISLS